MSFGTVVSLSQVTLDIFNSCKLLPNHTDNSRRSCPSRRSVANRSQSITGQSEVASVSRRPGRGCGSGARVYADRLTNGVRGSQARQSVAVRSQATLITWPIIHFLLLVCQSLLHIDVNAILRSDDKNLTTAHESKKSRILQLVNRS